MKEKNPSCKITIPEGKGIKKKMVVFFVSFRYQPNFGRKNKSNLSGPSIKRHGLNNQYVSRWLLRPRSWWHSCHELSVTKDGWVKGHLWISLLHVLYLTCMFSTHHSNVTGKRLRFASETDTTQQAINCKNKKIPNWKQFNYHPNPFLPFGVYTS